MRPDNARRGVILPLGVLGAVRGVSCACTAILGPWRVGLCNPPLMSSAFVGMAHVRADHLDSDHRTAPGAPVADRQVLRRCLASVVGITVNLFPGEYTAPSRLIPSRVTRSQAAEPQAGTDRGTGTKIGSHLDVCFRADYVRSSPKSGHSEARAGLPLVTQVV